MYKNNKVLLVSHNFKVAGAPMSMLSVAKILKKAFEIEVWGLTDGPLVDLYRNELKIEPKIINQYNYLSFSSRIKTFNFVYINTIVGYNMANICQCLGIPYIWVIREASNIPQIIQHFNINEKYLIKVLSLCQNSIYSVSDYAKQYIDNTFNINVKVLNNFIEDTFVKKYEYKNKKLEFTLFGCHEKRKGVDILVEAIKQISSDCILNICGDYENKYGRMLVENTKHYPNIHWHGIVFGKKKQDIMNKTDVFVVPSLDESSSRIVLESLMLYKPVIVTENVGAKYMVTNQTGWIVKTGDIVTLKECIKNIINNPDNLTKMGFYAREMYLKTSTPEIYEKKIYDIINEKIKESHVNKNSTIQDLKFFLKHILLFLIYQKTLFIKKIKQFKLKKVKQNISDINKLIIKKVLFYEKIKNKVKTKLKHFIENEVVKKLEYKVSSISKQIEEQNNFLNNIKNQIAENQKLQNIEFKNTKKEINFIQNRTKEIMYAEVFRDCSNRSEWLKEKNFTLTLGAANYSFVYILFKILDEFNPKNILEMGLGQTTKLTSQYASYYQDSTLHVVEHNKEWIEAFSKKLELNNNVRIFQRNLMKFMLNDIESDKYDSLDEIVEGKKYDLIIIDGPFGFDRVYPRTNILDLIPQNLAKNFIIILDDAERVGEKNTAELIFKKLIENNIEFKKSYKIGLKTQLIITSTNYEFIHWY